MRRKKVNTFYLSDVKQHIATGKNFFWNNNIAINLKANADTLTQSLLVPHSPYCLAENRIILVQDGRLQFRLDLIEYKVQKGDIAFIPKGSIVEIEDISADYECRMITFAEVSNSNVTEDFTMPIILQNHYSAPNHCSRLIDSIFSLLTSEEGHTTSSLIVLSALTEYIKECFLNDFSKATPTQKRTEHIHNKFLRLVRENYHEHRDTGWYADKLCISKHYLHHCVSTTSGKSVQQWISLAVIQQAQYLLKYSELPIYEIASQAGFTSHAFFTRYFKQKTGTTPEAYRRNR